MIGQGGDAGKLRTAVGFVQYYSGAWVKNSNNQGGECPNCLDPSTLNNNIFGYTYPGGDNPRTFCGRYTYSYVPKSLAEYPAIGHDRRYDNLGASGALGLLVDGRTVGADWKFVKEESDVAGNPNVDQDSRVNAYLLGTGLGMLSLPKTLMQLTAPGGIPMARYWYKLSDKGVTNNPSIHRH